MPRKKNIWLGIDPGIARMGFGIVEETGGTLVARAYGCVTTPKENTPPKRFQALYKTLNTIIKKHKPHKLALEKIFFAKNTKTALTVGEARGVVLLLAGIHNVPLVEFTPLQIKQAVTGYGRADKQQMQKMVKLILGLKQIPKPDDTADALAAAICGIQTKILT